MSEYRIVEENRQIWIEQLVKGKSWDSWVAVDKPNVPRYHPTVADARSWVKTIKRGVVYHEPEDDGLQWFLDRVGKTVVRDAMRVVIIDTDHARHLHTASVEMGYVYTDAPNLPVDERKAESGNKVCDEWESLITRNIAALLMQRGLVNGISIYNVTVDDEYIRIYT